MTTSIVVSLRCESERALLVLRAAVTHPNVTRHLYDEQTRLVHVELDLACLETRAERCLEGDRVLRWLEFCRDERRELSWDTWLLLVGMVA